MKKKAMLSQPMAGKTDKEIVAAREKAIADLEAMGYEVVNTYFTDEWYSDEAMEKRGVVQVPLCYLAKSLENMSLCHAGSGLRCSLAPSPSPHLGQSRSRMRAGSAPYC